MNYFLLKNLIKSLKKVILYFWSYNNEIYKIINKNVNKILLKKNIEFIKINIECNKYICEKFTIKQDFIMIIFNSGKLLNKYTNFTSNKLIRNIINKNFNL